MQSVSCLDMIPDARAITINHELEIPNMHVIRRHAKSSEITKEDIVKNPQQALLRLLRGHVFVFSKLKNFAERGLYGSMDNEFQQGENTFHIQLLIPPHMADTIEVHRDERFYGYDATRRVAAVSNPSEYSSIGIPEHMLGEVIEHAIVYGGKVSSEEPLEPVYIGAKAQKIVEQLTGRNC